MRLGSGAGTGFIAVLGACCLTAMASTHACAQVPDGAPAGLQREIASRLGPHKRGRSCWYVKSYEAADESALRDLILAGLDDLRSFETVTGT